METARVRIESQKVVPYQYPDGAGEVVQVKASGFIEWPDVHVSRTISFPVSLHFTIPPGSNLSAPLGDHLKLTIEREG